MPCGWEGNRRSGDALAMRHRLQWFVHLLVHGLRKGNEHPTYPPHGVRHTLPYYNSGDVMYTRSQKKQDTKFLPITSPNVDRFSHSFAGRLSVKSATSSYLNIPPHLKYVATLHCEISTTASDCGVRGSRFESRR